MSARKVQTMGQRTTVTSETTPKRRILIVDDHAIVRLGMRQLIAAEPDLSICCEADTGEEALALALKGKPDLAIVDLSLGTRCTGWSSFDNCIRRSLTCLCSCCRCTTKRFSPNEP
jgi:DNA-binding NtrC family response regulator